MSRPMAIDESTVRILEKAFHDGATIEEACSIAQIARSTYYKYISDDLEFSDTMMQAQSYPNLIAKKNLVTAIAKGDINTSRWWLERRARAEFSLKYEPPVIDLSRERDIDTGLSTQERLTNLLLRIKEA